MCDAEQALIEEQRQQVYALYERKAKHFRRTWISVLALGIVVFGLIFYPYVNFRGDRYELEAEIKQADRDIDALRARLAEHAQWLEAFRDHVIAIDDRIRSFRLAEPEGTETEHRRRLSTIRAALADDPDLQPWLSGQASATALPAKLRRKHALLANANDDPCFWLTGNPWRHCALAERLQRLHREVSDRFAYKRISHVRNELFVPLYDSLTVLHDDFRAWLLGEKPAWETPELQTDGSLAEQFDAFREIYLRRIDQHERTLHQLRLDSEASLRDLEDLREAKHQTLQIVVTRLREMQNLQDIETPFGTLPVGLNDLVLLFPILLAAGFWLAASLLAETLQLRGIYHRLCRERDPNQRIFTPRHIALVAPTWIDPLHARPQRISRWLALLLPAAIFVVAIALLLANRLLGGEFMQEVRLNTAIYSVLYVASALLMIEGGRRLWLSLRLHT